MMTHRSFLLALLAATFMCIVVLQMSLDGWLVGRTVHYTIGLERKGLAFNISIVEHNGAESPSQNSSGPSGVEQPEYFLSLSNRSSVLEPTLTLANKLLQQQRVLGTFDNPTPSPQYLTTSNPHRIQRTHTVSKNKLPTQVPSAGPVNLSLQEVLSVSLRNSSGQSSKSIATSTSNELDDVSKGLPPPPPQMAPNASVSQLLESRSRKLSSWSHSNASFEIKTEISDSKSSAGGLKPPTSNPKQDTPQEKTNDSIQARIKVRSFDLSMKSKEALQHRHPQELISPQARLQEILRQGSSLQVRSRPDPLYSLRNVPTVEPSKVKRVILLTYFRSGSTFVGDLLQQNWKTFYHFEPLHFMTYDSRIGRSKIQEAFDLIGGILRCNFSNQESYLKWVKRPDNQFLFERNVFLWFSCKTNPRMCFTPEMVSAVCQRAPVQIMKVTRLHMRYLKEFLSRNPDIQAKVVFLVRDPRGVISSRRTLDWCSGTECSDPHILCPEMEDDLKVFHELQDLEPHKFIKVLYEDIALNPEKEAKRLFEFLDLPFSLSVRRFLKTHTTARKADNLNPYSTRRNSSSMAFSWKSRLTFAQIRAIQEPCSQVIQELNYTLITSPVQLPALKRTKPLANNSSLYNRSASFETSDKLLRLDNSKDHLPESKTNSSSSLQAVGKRVPVPSYTKSSASAGSRRHFTLYSSTDSPRSGPDSSEVGHFQSRLSGLHSYDHTLNNW